MSIGWYCWGHLLAPGCGDFGKCRSSLAVRRVFLAGRIAAWLRGGMVKCQRKSGICMCVPSLCTGSLSVSNEHAQVCTSPVPSNVMSRNPGRPGCSSRCWSLVGDVMTLLPSSPDVFCRSGSHAALCKATFVVLGCSDGWPSGRRTTHLVWALSLQCICLTSLPGVASLIWMGILLGILKVKRCRGGRQLEKDREHSGCLSCIINTCSSSFPKEKKNIKNKNSSFKWCNCLLVCIFHGWDQW